MPLCFGIILMGKKNSQALSISGYVIEAVKDNLTCNYCNPTLVWFEVSLDLLHLFFKLFFKITSAYGLRARESSVNSNRN